MTRDNAKHGHIEMPRLGHSCGHAIATRHHGRDLRLADFYRPHLHITLSTLIK
jgi:hypothetical protein